MLPTSCLCLEHFVPFVFRNLFIIYLLIYLFTYYTIMAEVTFTSSFPTHPPFLADS